MIGFRHWVAFTLAATLGSVFPLVAAERTVQPPAETARQIDREIQAGLDAAQTPTSPPADDAEFVRRVFLDLHGVVPPVNRVVTFLNDRDPDKRAKLIDELLADPQYGRHFGLMWFNRMVPRAARALGIVDESLWTWLGEQFNENRGWDEIVANIVQSEGERDANPGTVFFLAALNDNRENPQPAPDKVAAAVSRLFLGLRLECCQCHNHPFNQLKQTDFWETAAFFVNVRFEVVKREGQKPNTMPVLHEGVAVASPKPNRPGTPISATAVIEIPESGGKTVQAKFLHGATLETPSEPRFRPALAQWLVAPANRQFARAAVNRMWAEMFGQGLVDPVDDMQPEHACTHPELLELLTDEFIASGYDLKHLIRCLTGSRAYQRTSTPPPGRKNEPELYGHMAARVLTADQLYDSLARISGHEIGERISSGGQKRKYGDSRERFRMYFQGGGDDANTPVPAYGHGIPQVLRIMNSPSLTDGSKLIEGLLRRRFVTTEDIIAELYLATLARYPTPTETQRATEYLADEPDPAQGYADVLWVLLNSGEFLHNH